ncbi:hypothetical protein B0H11DRAFT_1924473 [Mycena galericulata]|nr:hypothetical protein B0H11DRAFT_1924473 [Mycena galericulata]
MSQPVYRCELPYYPDPGQPPQPSADQKLYLVTGTGYINGRPIRAGAYSSWSSSGSIVRSVVTATCKGYLPHEREAMEAAWHASCDRGEHDHHARPNVAPLSVPLASPRSTPGSTPRPAPRFGDTVPPYLWSPKAPASPSPAPAAPASGHRKKKEKVKLFDKPIEISSRSPSPGAPPLPGAKSYAVRSGARGWVFSDLEEARNKYHSLQTRGRKVQMATATGFTRALAFAESYPPHPDSDEGRVRAQWSEAEARALRQNEAAERRRAEICEGLAAYREDESAASSDESDTGRATDELEDELNLRMAHGYEWKDARDARRAASKGKGPGCTDKLNEDVASADTRTPNGADSGDQEWVEHCRHLRTMSRIWESECYWHELDCQLCQNHGRHKPTDVVPKS